MVKIHTNNSFWAVNTMHQNV